MYLNGLGRWQRFAEDFLRDVSFHLPNVQLAELDLCDISFALPAIRISSEGRLNLADPPESVKSAAFRDAQAASMEDFVTI